VITPIDEAAMVAPDKGERFLERRRQRIDRRRGEILAAAARVIAEKGYANTGTKEIAEAAGMAEGTLYNYFGSKREILLAIAEETEAPMEAAVMETDRIPDRAALLAMAEKALEISVEQMAFSRAILSEVWVDDQLLYDLVGGRMKHTHQKLKAFVAERVKDGTFRSLDPGLTAQLIMGMFAAVIVPTVRGVGEPPSAEARHTLAEAIVALLLDGIARRA
jgi:AcrR family transcriptional regulator